MSKGLPHHSSQYSEPKPTYTIGFLTGSSAVRCKPSVAPRNPYDEDTQADAFNGWEDGAIEAGICEIYTNGILDESRPLFKKRVHSRPPLSGDDV